MDGILLVDKKKGETSTGTMNKIKKILRPKKIGHAGALDPFATGLLIILINQGTKLFNLIMSKEKVYHATILLGVETDTLDPEGNVVKEMGVPDLSEEEIKKKLKEFVGIIDQVPPSFSAVKKKGVRAYRLARKGIKVELEKRKVHIYEINLISWKSPRIKIEVKCSAGTYIRSLARDIAYSLGTCGYLEELRRISCGPFHVRDAIIVNKNVKKEDLENRIIPLVDALSDLPAIYVDERMAWRLRNGVQPKIRDKNIKEGYIKFVKENELVAIAYIDPDGKVKLERVFN